MKKPFIMLVDDEAAFVETMEQRLTHRDFRVLTAAEGAEALETLKTNQAVEVVILDVKMPGMDGIEVLKRIKENYPLMEVIMLTGNAEVDTAIEGMKLGAYDYLKKPVEIDDFVAKVQEAAEKQRERRKKIQDAAVREAVSLHGI